MTDSLTDGRLDELEALAANATPGERTRARKRKARVATGYDEEVQR